MKKEVNLINGFAIVNNQKCYDLTLLDDFNDQEFCDFVTLIIKSVKHKDHFSFIFKNQLWTFSDYKFLHALLNYSLLSYLKTNYAHFNVHLHAQVESQYQKFITTWNKIALQYDLLTLKTTTLTQTIFQPIWNKSWTQMLITNFDEDLHFVYVAYRNEVVDKDLWLKILSKY